MVGMKYTDWIAASKREITYCKEGFGDRDTIVYEWLDTSSIFHTRPLEERTADSTWTLER